MARSGHNWLTPALTLMAALVLSVLPLPQVIAPFRPDWVAVVLLYSSLIAPRRYGLLTAFWMGLALDMLSGALLGQHALALLLIVYLSQHFHLRIRVFPVSQLALTVVVLLALYEFVLFWVDGVVGRTVPLIERWAPVVSGTLLWALVLVFVERGRQAAAARM
ncbi:MAG TPA: rod shape-determining protein MreD [Gammaproteobacteria bacterium]